MSSYIDSINQAATASTGKTTPKTSDDAVMGKQDFLSLLVAQLQNQDPLNPDDPTEFTAQLAQFSSLEQLFTLNESMNNLVTSNANSDRMSTLSTIGKDVAYNGSSFNFTGEPVELGYQLDSPASEVTLDLQLNGVTVTSLTGKDLSAGSHYLTWDGLNKDGVKASAGDYKIVLRAKAASGESTSVAPLIKSEVTGVDLGGENGGTLVTKAGEIAFNSIIGVYDPGSRADTPLVDFTVLPAHAATSGVTADPPFAKTEIIEKSGMISIDKILRPKFVLPKLGTAYGSSMKIVFDTGGVIHVPNTAHDVITSDEQVYRVGGRPDIPTMEVYAEPGSDATKITIHYMG